MKQQNQRTYSFYICAICDLQTKFCCSGCQGPFYCSKEHQQQHWKMGHKLECNSQTTLINQEEIKEMQVLRQQLRSQLIKALLSNQSIDFLLSIQKQLEQQSNSIYKKIQKRNQYYESIVDQLFKPKIYIKNAFITQARQALLTIQQDIESFFRQFPVYTIQNTQLSLEQIKKDLTQRGNILLVMADLFYQCGDHINSSKYQAQRVINVELSEGSQSFEASKSYFEIGIYYINTGYLKRASGALQRSEQLYRDLQEQEKVADCQYYLGQIYAKLKNGVVAKEYLENSLKIRREVIGNQSLEVAECLQQLGLLLIDEVNYRSALSRLEESYLIKKFLYKNMNHPELIKACTILVQLFQKIRDNKRLPKLSDEELVEQLDQQVQRLQLEKELNFVFQHQIQSHFDIIANKVQDRENIFNGQLTTDKTLQGNANTLLQLQEFRNNNLKINKELMNSLSIDQLQLLKKLNQQMNLEDREVKELVLKSNFLKSLSKIQFEILKSENEEIFETRNNPWLGQALIDSMELSDSDNTERKQQQGKNEKIDVKSTFREFGIKIIN